MRTIILILVLVVIVLIGIPILLVCALFRLQLPLLLFAKGAIWLCIKILGLRIEIRGMEWIRKEQNYVFMANHLSYLDGPILFLAIPQHIRAIAKKTIFRLPIIGLAMKQVDFVPVDRRGSNSGKKSIELAVRLIIKKKYSYLIFPEGTRSPNGKHQAFRRGGFFLAINSGAPIVPVTIKGTYGLMPKGGLWIKRGTIQIEFFEPVSVKDSNEETMPLLMERIRKIILSGLTTD